MYLMMDCNLSNAVYFSLSFSLEPVLFFLVRTKPFLYHEIA